MWTIKRLKFVYATSSTLLLLSAAHKVLIKSLVVLWSFLAVSTSSPPKPPKRMAIAAFAFDARNEDELSFKPGDKVELRETPDQGGWWQGSHK